MTKEYILGGLIGDSIIGVFDVMAAGACLQGHAKVCRSGSEKGKR